MANGETGELGVIAVLPILEGHGIGARVLQLAGDWLAARGWQESWLKTSLDSSLRAYGFYRKHGWQDYEIRGGLRCMKMRLSRAGGMEPGGASN